MGRRYMMYSQIVIYRKPNGDILYRAIGFDEQRQIGDKNSYGWTVVGIQKIKEGRCYPIEEYNSLLQRKEKWGRLTKGLKFFIGKIDPVETTKWIFIGYIMLQLCQIAK